MKDKKNNSNRGLGNPYFKGLVRVGFDIDVINNLGDVQKEVLFYLCVEFMTPKQITNKRKTSAEATRVLINKLIAKALINKDYIAITGIKQGGTLPNKKGGGWVSVHPNNSKGEYRLHGQNHSLKILSTSLKYFKKLKEGNKIPLETNTIMLYRRKIVVYSNLSFFDDVPNLCFEKASIYWDNFFRQLENDLGIKLINGSHTQIKQFRCHIAKTNDPLARKVIDKDLFYEVRDDIGRLRLLIDNSKGLFEFEAVDNELCQEDINKKRDYDLDIIDKEGLKPSESKEWVDNFKTVLETNQSQHNEVLLMFKAQLKLNENVQKQLNERL